MNRYDRVRLLGQGTFGQAYVVKDKWTQQLLVAKEIDIRCKDNERDAYAEAGIMADIHCPFIVRFQEMFHSLGLITIVMEYCDNGDLTQQIQIQRKTGQFFEPKLVIGWISQVLQGVAYLHSQSIIHRDIKPANLFLTSHGGLKLGDLGFARHLEPSRNNSDKSRARTAIGTPMYMSPEQCIRQPYTNKIDIWAVGCCLYEMCTLYAAFIAQSLPALHAKILRRSEEKKIPSTFGPVLQSVVNLALSIDPDTRPAASVLLTIPAFKFADSTGGIEAMAGADSTSSTASGGSIGSIGSTGSLPLMKKRSQDFHQLTSHSATTTPTTMIATTTTPTTAATATTTATATTGSPKRNSHHIVPMRHSSLSSFLGLTPQTQPTKSFLTDQSPTTKPHMKERRAFSTSDSILPAIQERQHPNPTIIDTFGKTKTTPRGRSSPTATVLTDLPPTAIIVTLNRRQSSSSSTTYSPTMRTPRFSVPNNKFTPIIPQSECDIFLPQPTQTTLSSTPSPASAPALAPAQPPAPAQAQPPAPVVVRRRSTSNSISYVHSNNASNNLESANGGRSMDSLAERGRPHLPGISPNVNVTKTERAEKGERAEKEES